MLERIQEHITLASGGLLDIDRAIADVTFSFMIFASGLMQCVSGACFDDYKREVLIEETQFFGPTDHYSIFLPQLIFLHQRLRLLGSYSSKFTRHRQWTRQWRLPRDTQESRDFVGVKQAHMDWHSPRTFNGTTIMASARPT